MKDLQDILREIQRLAARSEPCVLATVVRISGSAYRGPGARLLVTQEGRAMGSISGGCLERDVLEHSQEVLATGAPQVLAYDSTSPDDILWGTGLGCSGRVEVLVERLPGTGGLDWPRFLAECISGQGPGVLATVFQVEGELPARPGQRLALRQDGAVESDLQEGELRQRLLQDARQELEELKATCRTFAQGKTPQYEVGAGRAAVLLEPILPPIPLVVFGAGPDALPVVRLARELGWQVTVVDHRPAFARPERLPEACAVVLAHPEEALARVRIDARTAVLLMTHNYLQDFEVLKRLAPRSFQYLGILGPRHRTQRLLEDLHQEGIELAEEQRQRVFSPVGLDLGAETAEEIALSVLGEIQATLRGRRGGPLRDSQSPIHDRPG